MSLNYNRLARTRTISNTQGFYGIKSGTIYLPYDWHVDSWDYICFYLGFDRLSDGGSMIEAGISRRGNDDPRGWYAFVNAIDDSQDWRSSTPYLAQGATSFTMKLISEGYDPNQGKYAIAFYINDNFVRRTYLNLGDQKVRCKYVNDTYEDSDSGGAGEVKYNWMRWTGMSLKTGTGENWSLWNTSYNNITESGTFTQPSGNDPKYTIEWINQWYEKRIKHNY
jgi:hypothetical protein